jgi:hypothetical protein
MINKIICFIRGHDIHDRRCDRCGTSFGIPKMSDPPPPPKRITSS